MALISENSKLLVILGPTASGKTRLAVQVAAAWSGEIISADSRQVYRGMDIGTGKDLEEYQNAGFSIPHHLIDIVPAGEKYNLNEFLKDAQKAAEMIFSKGKVPMLCGGTGLYIHALLMGYGSASIPVNEELRQRLDNMTLEELTNQFNALDRVADFQFDMSTRKRAVRNIEILEYLKENPEALDRLKNQRRNEAVVFGLNPPVEIRRRRITERLDKRLKTGLIEEVEELLKKGLSAEQLIYYGLEYKYVTLFLTGQLTFTEMRTKLETEIHRFAKRQMTFFRKMEKDGIDIHWLDDSMPDEAKINLIKNVYEAQ